MPHVAGWRERVELPDLHLHLAAKLDTGARSSAIDARDPRVFERAGASWCRFEVPLEGGDVTVEAPLLGMRWVKDSGGHGALRHVVRTTVRLAGESWPIELTLAHREGMSHRMLLGRSALKGRFFVDAASVELLTGVVRPIRRMAGA